MVPQGQTAQKRRACNFQIVCGETLGTIGTAHHERPMVEFRLAPSQINRDEHVGGQLRMACIHQVLEVCEPVDEGFDKLPGASVTKEWRPSICVIGKNVLKALGLGIVQNAHEVGVGDGQFTDVLECLGSGEVRRRERDFVFEIFGVGEY